MRKKNTKNLAMASGGPWVEPVLQKIRDIRAGNGKSFLMVRYEPIPYVIEWMQKFFGKFHLINMGYAGRFASGVLTPVPEEVWEEKVKEPRKWVFEAKWRDGKVFTYSDIEWSEIPRLIKMERY